MTPPDIEVGPRPGHHSRTEGTDNTANGYVDTTALRCPSCAEMCSRHACFPKCGVAS